MADSPRVPAVSLSLRARRFADVVLSQLYPANHMTCVVCHRAYPLAAAKRMVPVGLASLVCPLCAQEHRANPDAPRRGYKHRLASNVYVYSRFKYEGLIPRLIRPWKYDGILHLTPWFASELSDVFTPRQQLALDAIVPVPTSHARFRERGYHHTLLLAKALSRDLRRPVVHALYRNTGAETQTAKSAVARSHVLSGVFHVNPEVDVCQRRIVLVDDVMTTGATLQACADKLIAAGAAFVVCLVIAHVE